MFNEASACFVRKVKSGTSVLRVICAFWCLTTDCCYDDQTLFGDEAPADGRHARAADRLLQSRRQPSAACVQPLRRLKNFHFNLSFLCSGGRLLDVFLFFICPPVITVADAASSSRCRSSTVSIGTM